MKLVSAKCPNCGASLKLSKEKEETKCDYCKNTIIVDEAIACFKLKVSGKVSVEGISTNADLIEVANELLDMNEYLKAKRKFLEFSEKCPDDYQGWLGLLICRTRNFTIRDNNIMFENDVNKYRDHFFRVAPEDVKEQYFETIDRYFDPEKYIRMKEQEKAENLKKELEKIKKQTEEKRKQKLEKKEKLKSELLESSTYKKASEISNKGKNLLFKIGNIILYGFGGLVVLAFLSMLKENFISNFLLILFGLSLFKIFYSIVEDKFNIDGRYILIARFIIPFLLLVLAATVTPVPNNDSITKESDNDIVDKDKDPVTDNQFQADNNTSKKEDKANEKSKETIYYINYNELGEFGKYMEFEKKSVIFYYLPDGKYNIEATTLNENMCFLWIDYREGYQNGNYGTAYETKKMLKFTTTSQIETITIDSSVHIYNSNDCNYKLTLIK